MGKDERRPFGHLTRSAQIGMIRWSPSSRAASFGAWQALEASLVLVRKTESSPTPPSRGLRRNTGGHARGTPTPCASAGADRDDLLATEAPGCRLKSAAKGRHGRVPVRHRADFRIAQRLGQGQSLVSTRRWALGEWNHQREGLGQALPAGARKEHAQTPRGLPGQ